MSIKYKVGGNKVEKIIEGFIQQLKWEEKSINTIKKYTRDVRAFLQWKGNRAITKETTLAYKQNLSIHYAPASANSMLVALNRFLQFLKKPETCVKTLRVQRQIFCQEEQELSRGEYHRLLQAARGTQLWYILQTLSGTGIRVGELESITVEAVAKGRAKVQCKSKTRIILIPGCLKKVLRAYLKKARIKSGPVFVTKHGKPLNRSYIWRAMKKLCEKATVSPRKVFPHNLRRLFARTYYSLNRDIVRLADLLGHSSVNTTRIYTMESGSYHLTQLEQVATKLNT